MRVALTERNFYSVRTIPQEEDKLEEYKLEEDKWAVKEQHSIEVEASKDIFELAKSDRAQMGIDSQFTKTQQPISSPFSVSKRPIRRNKKRKTPVLIQREITEEK